MFEVIALNGACCKTRYPVVLIHGAGFRDRGYWGRIPKMLQERGAQVFFGSQDGWATVEQNGTALKRRLEEILAETSSEKVHLIAHSKGGLDARYMISSLGMAPQVASLSMIATPNHGSKTMDLLYRMPKWVFRLAGLFVNAWYRLIGDQRPDFCNACFQFTTAWAEEFNRKNPDAAGVFYRSYTGVMRSFRSDVFMWWQNLLIHWVEGENDGMVTVESAAWTGFRGPWYGAGGRGVSHMDEVDFRRHPLKYHKETNDIAEHYIKMVAELKELGM